MDRFVWKIENFGSLKGEYFKSLYFTSSKYENLQLLITQSNTEILVQVLRQNAFDVYCSVSILDPDGSPLINQARLTRREEKINALIFPNDKNYFFNNSLVVECYIWHNISTPANLSIMSSRFAFTQVETNTKVVKKIFRPQIFGFTDLSHSSLPFVINGVVWNGSSFKIEIKFSTFDQGVVSLSTISWFGFRAKIIISAIDASGKTIKYGNHDALFTSEKRTHTFKLNASKAMFLQHKNKFLPSDTLSLIVSCTLTGHFAIDRIVEESEIFNNSTANNALNFEEISKTTADDTETVLNEPEAESETNAPNTILQSLQDILKDGYLSDFSLKVGDRTFPVHKNILGARSKYFRAMFDSEMKEIQDNCVEIQNVDAETLRRMLQFMYSDRLDEELDSAEACSLYAAADFYALEPLKKSCSEILVDNLCIESVLTILSMADLHRDQKLKSAALDFISLNDKNIIGTKDWIQFEKENANLALETFRELYSRKME